MAKVVKRASHKKAEDEPHDALPIDDSPNEEALHEAAFILEALSKTTPNLMGTAHGLALIHAAQKWMAQYNWVKA